MASVWNLQFGSAWSANTVLASPNGAAGILSPRALVAADIPSLSAVYLPLSGGTLSGTLTLPTLDLTGDLFDVFGSSGLARQVLLSVGSVAGVEWAYLIASDYPTMLGDAGSGGTKGAVPAPGAGDAAAKKFLLADGTWAVPAGTGTGLTSVGLSTNASYLTVGSSPLTSNGTITLNKATGLTANQVVATPNGATGVADLRALVLADLPSGYNAWSNLANATAGLTLSNGANATEFDQTSNVVWKWTNTTTGTVATTNASPLLELSANAFHAASSTEDIWSIGTSLLAGTDKTSSLNITHVSGSTGPSVLQLGLNTYLGINGKNAGPSSFIQFQINGNNVSGLMFGDNNNLSGTFFGGRDSTSNYICLGTDSPSASLNGTSTGHASLVYVGSHGDANPFSFTATANLVGILCIGSADAESGNFICNNSFAPASGSAYFVPLRIEETINMNAACTGGYSAIRVKMTETSLPTSPSSLLFLDLWAGSTPASLFSINNKGIVSNYGAVATVKGGVGAQVAVSDLVTQSAAIAATTIYAVPASGAGLYRISYVATITTAGAGSSVLGGTAGFQVVFQNKSDSVTKTSNPTTPVISSVDATGTTISGALYANCKASSNLQYAMGYTSAGNAMVYDLSIRVEYLG